MVVVQYGQAKSGSSFIYQILTDLFQNRFLCWSDYFEQRNSLVPPKYHGDYIAIPGDEIEEIISLIPKLEFFLFKTHDAPYQLSKMPHEVHFTESMQDWINTNRLKVIATFRDPRDMCISYFDHAESHRRGEKDFFDNEIHSPFDAVSNVKNEYRILKYWMKYDKIHWVSYPQICKEPYRVLEAMKKYIGLYHIDSTLLVDKLLNNKNRIHQFNKGQIDRWQMELSEEDGYRLTELLADEIKEYQEVCKRADKCILRADREIPQ